MKNRTVGYVVLGLLLWTVFCMPSYEDAVTYVWTAASRPVVVLDPGHGGIDGGAESSSGMAEKNINLKIAKSLQKRLEAEEIKVIMTRDSDEGLYAADAEGAIRSLKTQDMYEREAIIKKSRADLVVSIHLNSFTQDASVKGAQVFYPSDGDGKLVKKSKQAAEIMQKNLNQKINVDKKRTELGKNDVLLLRNIYSPIVIVECGFLSNPEDAENLKKEQYQEKISKALKVSVCKYLKENGNKTQ